MLVMKQRLERVSRMVDEKTLSLLQKTIELTMEHNRWRRREALNLIASENVMSSLAERAYMSDFMYRYAEGKPFKRYYQGTRYVDELETELASLMGEMLGVDYVETRPISGTIANASVFRVLASPGDRALIAPVQAGSHVSHTKFGTLGALGIMQVSMPYDEENMNVDVDGALKMIREVKPKFIVLGGSVYLFPHPVEELAQAARDEGAKVVYDAAHVLGLIVGGAWPNPLKRGADIMTGSTHKTFPGPQGGIIAFASKEDYKPVSKTVFPYWVSNHHLHRIPATLITALEMKEWGKTYAEQVVKNAQKLAEVLHNLGFRVLGEHLGFTKSHQVLVDVSSLGGGAKAAELLEEANIIVNKNLIPKDPEDKAADPSGIRIGVQEMTRLGMVEEDMYEVAGFIKRVLIDRDDPARVRGEVVEFRKYFQKVRYGFEMDIAETHGLSLLDFTR